MERMRRIRMAIVWSVCVVGICAGPILADEAQTPACKLGYELRMSTGFGPRVLAALGADEAKHTAIATAATTYCEQHRQTVETLLSAVKTAKQTTFRRYELAGDVAATDTAFCTALTALATGTSDVITTMNNVLSAEQRVKRAHLADNRLLELRLALLDLTAAQRTALRAAQTTRDLALRHHKDRKALSLVKEALETFQTVIDSTLSAAQKTEHAQLETTLRQNLIAIMTREAGWCEAQFAEEGE